MNVGGGVGGEMGLWRGSDAMCMSALLYVRQWVISFDWRGVQSGAGRAGMGER